MIPKYEPPFTFPDLLCSIAHPPGPNTSTAERFFAEHLGVPYAVSIPSGRAGIQWAVRAAQDREGGTVVTPTYTCQVVHEAILYAGAKLHFLDCGQDSILMEAGSLSSLPHGTCAVVLSELFGQTYDLKHLAGGIPATSILRVLDMTSTVPTSLLLNRLEARDVAVISFGISKCIYAGWGGMALTRDQTVAEAMRAQRQEAFTRKGKRITWLSGKTFLYASLQGNRAAYTVSAETYSLVQAMRRTLRQESRSGNSGRFPSDPSPIDPEWWQPPTPFNHQLAIDNQKRASAYVSARQRNEEVFRRAFRDRPEIIVPPPSDGALSHFSVLVPAALRDQTQAYLRRCGIDSGTQYIFPFYLPAECFPRSLEASRRILNLPVSNKNNPERIRWIAERLMEAVREG